MLLAWTHFNLITRSTFRNGPATMSLPFRPGGANRPVALKPCNPVRRRHNGRDMADLTSSPSAGAPGARTEAFYAGAALLLLGALGVLRLWVVQGFELQGDEAYYWLWSKHLDYGYYSKGPGIAAAIWAGTRLFGDTVLGVRFTSVLLSVLSGLALFEMGRRLFDARTGFWTVVLAATIPLFIAGSLLMTIDPLSVFCWLAAVLTFWKAANTERAAPGWWIATGGLIGLGMLCKFTNAAQIVSFLLFCLWAPGARRHLRRPGFYLMILTAAAFLAPVLLWNERHGWITAQHLTHRGALDQAFRPQPGATLEFWATQALVFSPLYFAGLVWALCRKEWNGPRARPFRYLLSLAAPLPVFYTVLSLNGKWEANWTAPALAVCPVLLAASWLAAGPWRPGLRRWVAGSIALGVVLTAGLHAALVTPFMYGDGRFRRIGGAEDLARQVARAQQELGAAFVICGGYQVAALMSFYLPGQPTAFIVDEPGIQNQFSLWPGYGASRRAGESAIFVGKSPVAPEELAPQFESVALLGEVWSHYHGKNLRTYALFLCRGLKTGAVAAKPDAPRISRMMPGHPW